MSNHDLIELTLHQAAETVSAWGVTEADKDEHSELIWLPKSQCETPVDLVNE